MFFPPYEFFSYGKPDVINLQPEFIKTPEGFYYLL